MGRALLIIVIGVAALLSILKANLSSNSTQEVDNSINFFKKTQARLVANSGIEVYLEKLRRNKNLTGHFGNNSLMYGTYDVAISGPDSALQIVSNSAFYGTTHRSFVFAKRTPIEMPKINAALYINNALGLGLNLNGNMYIDGNDRNTDGSPGPNPPVSGVGLDSPADSAYFKNNVKPKITNDILGAGASPSIRTVADTTDWLAITEALIFAADITIPSGTYSDGTYGTPSEPKVTYISGDVELSGYVQCDGIMIVNGNLTLSGNSTFRGILLVYKNSSIETNFVGNGGIFGGTIIAGTNVNIQSTGNSRFYYSSQALANAQAKLKSSRFEIVDWWE